MKKKYFYCAILSIGLLLTPACTQKQEKKEQQKKEEYQDAFDKVDELQQKAATDTAFKNSKTFAAEMERAAIELAKKKENVNDNEKLLIEFESSLKVLKQYSDRLKKDSSLVNKSSYMRIVEEKTSKVRDYQQALKKANLNASEKKKFEELEHQ